MKTRSSMSYDVVAFETDELAYSLNETEEGIFHRMLRKAWINGSVPADLRELAALCRTRPSTLKKAWPKLSKMWVPDQENPSRLRNKKQESERIFQEYKRELATRAGKLSAISRENKENDSTDVEQTLNGRSTPLPSSPLPVSSTNVEEREIQTPLPPSPAAKPIDSCVASFVEVHLTERKVPYAPEKKDWVQLARLRKAYHLSPGAAIPEWAEAVTNYFASPLSRYTLADLCCRYATFHEGPLDRFNKPVNHKENGNGKLSRDERVLAEVKRTTRAVAEMYRVPGDSAGPDIFGRAEETLRSFPARLDRSGDPWSV